MVKDGSNLIVHLSPAPVILRIATLTARVRHDPLPYLASEVALVSYLAAVGAPVMAPSPLVPAGPYVVDGWALSAWQLVEHQPERVPDVRAAFTALDELHAAMRGFPDELPWLNPAVDDFDRALAFALETELLSASEAADLTRRRDGLLDELRALAPERQALHGDLFARNAVMTARGPRVARFRGLLQRSAGLGPGHPRPARPGTRAGRRDRAALRPAGARRRHGPPDRPGRTLVRIHEARLEQGW